MLFGHGYNPDQPEVQIEDMHKLPIMLPLCVYAIRDFWHARKLPSRSAAIRRLIERGLEAEKKGKAKHE